MTTALYEKADAKYHTDNGEEKHRLSIRHLVGLPGLEPGTTEV